MKNTRIFDCDIFCAVIDNYGDIGVCWCLARQLAQEHGVAVRLWVDDLASFAKLCPTLELGQARQWRDGVEVCQWGAPFPEVRPADWVIGAFACVLPDRYVAAMAAQAVSPVWLNLEYLSAEDWVAGCHRLPSPHPTLPLTKYFFFPGFTADTGGLLLERDLLARRDAFWREPAQQQQFWQSIGMAQPVANTLKVSLFAYENDTLGELFDVWAQGEQAVLCLVPEGRIVPQIEGYFAEVGRASAGHVGLKPDLRNYYAYGHLEVRILPFVPQADYDKLLWACDVNFVRGEDSFVRAQWAGKPFVWHIYPQHDAAHQQKLQAFLELYTAGLSPVAAQAMQSVWQRWNGMPHLERTGGGRTWADLLAVRAELEAHAHDWAATLAENSLTLNLLDFYREIGRMRAFKIEGQ